MTHPKQIRLIEPFMFFMLIGAAIIYMLNVFNTGSWLWFQGKVNTTSSPTRIVIIDNGQKTVLQPGAENFQELSAATMDSLQKFGNTDLINVGLSDQTLADYDTNSLIIEVYFDSPLQFDTLARVGEPTQLLIPINGRHAAGSYVFRGDQGEWWFGALRMADPSPLYTVLNTMGFEAAVLQSGS